MTPLLLLSVTLSIADDEAALRLATAAAGEYVFRGDTGKPFDLRREPVLNWSNPEAGDVHGHVFVWTRGGRPAVVGSVFHWRKPGVMEHEFHSLADGPLTGAFHGEPVWTTAEGGIRFAPLPGVPAAGDAPRLVQMKQLAKEFTATGTFGTSATPVALRLLPQPLFRYAGDGVASGGLFAFVRATDPEIVLLIEAHGKENPAWRWAAVRMHSMADLRLRHKDADAWRSGPLTFRDTFEKHDRPYTAYRFKTVPDFLKP